MIKSSWLDIMLLRPPQPVPTGTKRLSSGEQPPSPPVPTLRLLVSFVGIVLGTFCSFYITGLRAPEHATSTEIKAKVGNFQGTADSQITPDVGANSRPLWKSVIIAVVIAVLIFPPFYHSLKLYESVPVFVVFCFAFQNGYFWEALIGGITH